MVFPEKETKIHMKAESFIKKSNREQQAIDYYVKIKNEIVTITHRINTTEPIDNIINSANTTYIVEIKVRTKYTSQQIRNYGGAFIEQTKLKGILKYIQKNNIVNPNVLYFNFFSDILEIYELDLNINNYNWEEKYLQKDDYDKKRINKFVACLDEPIERISYNETTENKG